MIISRQIRSFWAVAAITLLCAFGLGYQTLYGPLTSLAVADSDASRIAAKDLTADLAATETSINHLEDSQAKKDVKVTDDALIQADLVAVRLSLSQHDYRSARNQLTSLQNQISNWDHELAGLVAQTVAAGRSLQVPILIYHYTPPDFESQLLHLARAGYTTVDLDQVAAALHGQGSLPPKPVVITFDDGFADQMKAFHLLQKHNMKATFYIIDGGQASKYCIGAGRKYDQVIKCGDAYLTWGQVRELDHSGLITIAAHTVDHLDLSRQPLSVQRFQIEDGKRQLEAQLGHAVRHFAYPYGAYNALTLSLVKQAGFVTAVTTLPGSVQSEAGILVMHRVRNAFKLP